MYKLVIEQYLTKQGISYTVEGEQIKCRCLNPKHIDTNPSFQFNTHEGFCHCFSCGYKNHISKLSDIEIDEDTIREYEYSKLIEQLRVGTTDVAEQDVSLPPKAFDITWDVRHISGDLMQALGVYYCARGKYCGRLIFPIRNVDGTLLGYTSWIATPESLGECTDQLVEPTRPQAKYLHSYGLVMADVLYPTNLDDLDLKPMDGLHLTEGLFDALSLIQLGYPAVCNFGLGGPSQAKIGEFLSMGYSEIIPAFDNDAAGMKGWQNIRDDWAEHIHVQGPSVILRELKAFECKDMNEYLTKKITSLREV